MPYLVFLNAQLFRVVFKLDRSLYTQFIPYSPTWGTQILRKVSSAWVRTLRVASIPDVWESRSKRKRKSLPCPVSSSLSQLRFATFYVAINEKLFISNKSNFYFHLNSPKKLRKASQEKAPNLYNVLNF